MNHRNSHKLMGTLLISDVALAISPPVIEWDIVAGDAIGQSAIGLPQAGDVAVGSGFWHGMEGAPQSTVTPMPPSTPTGVPPTHDMYLPLVQR